MSMINVLQPSFVPSLHCKQLFACWGKKKLPKMKVETGDVTNTSQLLGPGKRYQNTVL